MLNAVALADQFPGIFQALPADVVSGRHADDPLELTGHGVFIQEETLRQITDAQGFPVVGVDVFMHLHDFPVPRSRILLRFCPLIQHAADMDQQLGEDQVAQILAVRVRTVFLVQQGIQQVQNDVIGLFLRYDEMLVLEVGTHGAQGLGQEDGQGRDELRIEPENDPFETPVTRYTPQVVKASYRLPAVLHFPDYGIMRVACDNPDVYLQEHFVPDYENTGLNLGTGNLGGHTVRMAWHLGSVVLSFHSEKPLDAVELKFTVEDENYPHLAGADMSDPKFNGLKRCWQNVFTVNPSSMTMGDNIQLGGVGHLALTFKSDLLPFTPKLDGTFSMHDALKNSIEKVFTTEGKIGPNNRITDFGWESTEVTLIALYNYLISTNDWPFVKKYINDISRLVKGVLESDKDKDGIFEAPFHGNRLTSDRESWNWWDDFAFGHKDAYLNLQAYRALGCMKKIYAKLKMQDDVDKVEAAMEKFRGAFHKTFYNPQTGVYAGWISQDGRMHDYMFTFITSMAINEGLVAKTDGQKMLRILLNQLAKEGYDYKYGVPGPSMPVAPEDKGTWDEMTRWGRYENGGLCGQAAQHFIQALYEVDMREQADHILFTMLDTYERDYTHSGVFTGYVRSVDWRTKGGQPTGYNYLADNYYFLLSAITGHFRIPFPELTDPE